MEEQLEILESRAHRVLPALRDHRERLVLRVRLEVRAQPDHRGQPAHKVLREHRDHRVLVLLPT